MAISKDNILTEGLSGMIGNVIVFKTVRGKTIMANRPRKPTRQSELQRSNRSRFRNATAFAHAAMHDPQKKAYYWEKARKLKLPNAYTAAITDYMRRPAVTRVETPKNNGSAGKRLMITAGKKEFSLSSVEVNLVDKQGVSLGNSTAALVNQQKHLWVSHVPEDVSENVAQIIVTARDEAGNVSCIHHEHVPALASAA
jgi:hypothetical protein